ncbi:SubName: Full=Related to HSD1-ER membrane protein {ECO:0000313/EMBL:CCA67400.1} [Serendipita indica DSM 11827]|nr:SubName: Full=Related to HSD1-ER membrane protein {ECO:0000313/EMBL:CCA67400.1} [Serendipita indica DSM 11827]
MRSADSTAILKQVQPVRRRSARISLAASSNGSTLAEEPTTISSLIKASSMNELMEDVDDIMAKIDRQAARTHAVPNGNGHLEHHKSSYQHIDAIDAPPAPAVEPLQTEPTTAEVSRLEQSRPAPAKVDLEIPRKALHSSIGIVVCCLYAFDFTIPPIVAVLSVLLFGISFIDFIRLRNPTIETLYEKTVGFLMRESEKNKINGTVWYLIGVIFVLTFYPADIAVVSILILSWADTAASTIGRLWGRYTPPLPRRIPYIGLPFAPRKSTAGYAAAWVTGGLITCAFLSIHGAQAPVVPIVASRPALSWSMISSSNWEQLRDLALSYTNFTSTPVKSLPSSWYWTQRVGGGWPGLVVMAFWSGFATAVSEALDLGDLDDNLTLPILSGIGIWLYVALVHWIDSRWL